MFEFISRVQSNFRNKQGHADEINAAGVADRPIIRERLREGLIIGPASEGKRPVKEKLRFKNISFFLISKSCIVDEYAKKSKSKICYILKRVQSMKNPSM